MEDTRCFVCNTCLPQLVSLWFFICVVNLAHVHTCMECIYMHVLWVCVGVCVGVCRYVCVVGCVCVCVCVCSGVYVSMSGGVQCRKDGKVPV